MPTQGKLENVASEVAESLQLNEVKFVKAGAFKETYRTTNIDNDYVALKILDPLKCNIARTEREIEAMSKCNCDQIGGLIDFGEFYSKNQSYIYYLEEFFDGGSLADKIQNGGLSTNETINLGISMAQAIKYLKSQELVHRDVKPENIMYKQSSDCPVLVDFGLVRDLSQSSLTQTWIPQGPGTPVYSAPEQLNNEKQLIDWRTDQFSLGIVLSICLTGQHPFLDNGMTVGDAINAVANRNRCATCFCTKAKELKCETVLKMLEPWPVKRFNCPDSLIKALEKIGD